MSEKRIGKQTPTNAVILPYTESKGAQAIEIYNRSKRKAQQWQELMIEDIMAINSENLWVHMKFGWSVPRRNGKSEIAVIRAIYGLKNGEKVLYTAHRTTTSTMAYERILSIISEAGFVENEDYSTTKQKGLEQIKWLETGGKINFRTRSSKGGLGEGYDLLIIDEAQEYTSDQETALKYVVTDSKNPQTLMCGTPPTAVSSGTVFQKLRSEVLGYNSEDCGWAEWSVPSLSDTRDVDLWYETNPSLGTILSERTVRSELGEDTVDDNIQRLGLWLKYNQKSAISRQEWESFALDGTPVLCSEKRLFFGVKFAKNSQNVSLSVAIKTADEKIFVEAIDCRSVRDGTDWIIAFLRAKSAEKVVIDGAGNQEILVNNMKNSKVKCKTILPSVSEVIEANTLFENRLFDSKICHKNQPSLAQIIANCEHRAIGSKGGFGYSSIIEGADVSLVESVALAHWICANSKEKKKQIITY